MKSIRNYKFVTVEYHFDSDIQQNRFFDNVEIRFLIISKEMKRRFNLTINDDFKFIIELQEYEKLTNRKPKILEQKTMELSMNYEFD